MNRILRAFALALLAGTGPLASALPPFWDIFQKHYTPPGRSPLARARCGVCHVGESSSHNAYGKDLARILRQSQEETLTLAVLRQAEAKDSDGDGAANGDEIRAGFLPGDAKSRLAPPEATAPPPVEATPEAELIPKHSFHPLAVHFPVALFLFGAFLDLLGKLRRSGDLRRLAVWNLGFGALSSAVAMPTGVAAWLRLGLPFEGNLLTHFVLASTATVLMVGVASWRARKVPNSPGYWSILTATCVAVGATGHYGALLVYG